jgi:hypothetical protein
MTASYTFPAQAGAATHWLSEVVGHGGNAGSGGSGGSIGTPGAIAGAGLPFLLLAGGYVLVRRYRSRNRAE